MTNTEQKIKKRNIGIQMTDEDYQRLSEAAKKKYQFKRQFVAEAVYRRIAEVESGE